MPHTSHNIILIVSCIVIETWCIVWTTANNVVHAFLLGVITISYSWDVISGNLSKSVFFEVGWVTLNANFRKVQMEGHIAHQPLWVSEN